jgi:hypothetical protein
MSISNKYHYLILISLLLCCYFIYLSNSNSHQEFFSIVYRRCYTPFQSTIQWSYKYSYYQLLIDSLRKYLFDTCEEIHYLFTINIFYRLISLIN